MRIARTMTRLVLAGALAGLLSACGSEDGTQDYSKVKLFINELQPSNQTTIADENDEYDDWIEIYNAGDADVDLTGFLIGDSNPANTEPIQAGVTVAKKDVVLLWADKEAEQGPNHLGFKLSSSGDAVVLSTPDGQELDSVVYDAIVPDSQSVFGRYPDGKGDLELCSNWSPGALNGDSCLKTVSAD